MIYPRVRAKTLMEREESGLDLLYLQTLETRWRLNTRLSLSSDAEHAEHLHPNKAIEGNANNIAF